MPAYFPSDNSLPLGCNDMSTTVRILLNKLFSFFLAHGKDSYCCLGEEEILQIRVSLQENIVFLFLICSIVVCRIGNSRGRSRRLRCSMETWGDSKRLSFLCPLSLNYNCFIVDLNLKLQRSSFNLQYRLTGISGNPLVLNALILYVFSIWHNIKKMFDGSSNIWAHPFKFLERLSTHWNSKAQGLVLSGNQLVHVRNVFTNT